MTKKVKPLHPLSKYRSSSRKCYIKGHHRRVKSSSVYRSSVKCEVLRSRWWRHSHFHNFISSSQQCTAGPIQVGSTPNKQNAQHSVRINICGLYQITTQLRSEAADDNNRPRKSISWTVSAFCWLFSMRQGISRTNGVVWHQFASTGDMEEVWIRGI